MATLTPREQANLLARTGAAEWTRIATVRTTWWCLLAAAVTIVGMAALLALDLTSSPPRSEPWPFAWEAGQFALVPGQFGLLVLVVLVVTSEYATGAISATLQWTPRRAHVLVARAVVPPAVVTAAGVALVLAADLTAWAIFPDLRMSATGLMRSLGVVAGVLLAGSLIGVGAGLLLRSTAGALAVVFLSMLVLPFILPLFSVGWLVTATSYLPGAAAVFLLIGESPAQDVLTTASATAILVAWAAGALLAGALSFFRRDSS